MVTAMAVTMVTVTAIISVTRKLMARCAIIHITIPNYWAAIIGMRCRVINSRCVVINHLRYCMVRHSRSTVISMTAIAANTDTNIK